MELEESTCLTSDYTTKPQSSRQCGIGFCAIFNSSFIRIKLFLTVTKWTIHSGLKNNSIQLHVKGPNMSCSRIDTEPQSVLSFPHPCSSVLPCSSSIFTHTWNSSVASVRIRSEHDTVLSRKEKNGGWTFLPLTPTFIEMKIFLQILLSPIIQFSQLTGENWAHSPLLSAGCLGRHTLTIFNLSWKFSFSFYFYLLRKKKGEIKEMLGRQASATIC